MALSEKLVASHRDILEKKIMTLTREQIRQTLTSPIIYIDTNRSEIDARKENFLFCSPQYVDTAFRGTIIIDAKGTTFKIKKVTLTGKVNTLLSIKNFCLIKEVLPELDGEVRTISIDDFKELIIKTVSKKPRAWSDLDTIENISNDVKNCVTYKDVMAIFNLGLK
jgi:hypothetical protein